MKGSFKSIARCGSRLLLGFTSAYLDEIAVAKLTGRFSRKLDYFASVTGVGQVGSVERERVDRITGDVLIESRARRGAR